MVRKVSDQCLFVDFRNKVESLVDRKKGFQRSGILKKQGYYSEEQLGRQF